ncbi:MAG: hypothetical protein WC718_01240 [Phycisphaerales bacterium]|jgi:hypothetical protein
MAFANLDRRYSAHTAECAYGSLENINAEITRFLGMIREDVKAALSVGVDTDVDGALASVREGITEALWDVLSEAREAVEERFDAVPLWGA